ncbi:hypothetical protein ACE6H2_024181 [Prunus campanulata]
MKGGRPLIGKVSWLPVSVQWISKIFLQHHLYILHYFQMRGLQTRLLQHSPLETTMYEICLVKNLASKTQWDKNWSKEKRVHNHV